MFIRRLILLAVAMLIVFGVLTAQLARLSVAQGKDRRATAEAKLQRRTYLATARGEILDRHGRKLATDRASFDLVVDYDVITGSWEHDQAYKEARSLVGSTAWDEMSPEQRGEAAQLQLPIFQALTDRFWGAVCYHGDLTEVELTERRDSIRAEVQSLAGAVWDRQHQVWKEEQVERQRNIMASKQAFKPQEIREHRQFHLVLPRINEDVAFALRRLLRDVPDIFEVRDSLRREYPSTEGEVEVDRMSLPRPLRSAHPLRIAVRGVADHMLGSMRTEVWAEDVRRRPFNNNDLGGYRYGDRVGKSGLEYTYEDYLRGLRGQIVEQKDTGDRTRTAPAPGADLHMTIDIQLQQRTQAILSHELGLTVVQRWHKNAGLPLGTPLNSAAVILEVATGEVLAAVTMPTIAMGMDMDDCGRLLSHPWMNRATEAIYPPGSIIKPLILCAAIEEGEHSLNTEIECKGHFFPDVTTSSRCWIYRDRHNMATHGPLKAVEAIARSCNIHFYTLGDKLGVDRINDWMARFGAGHILNIGLSHEILTAEGTILTVGESAGSFPTSETLRERDDRKRERRRQTISLAIGQGLATWTPMHAANAYATLARRGAIRDATIVLEHRRSDPTRPDLNLSDSLVDATMEGLRQSVEERHGSGYHLLYHDGTDEPIINATGVTTWAKTGTAQAPLISIDAECARAHGFDPEVIREKGIDHSWFVGMVGPKGSTRPLYIIAVIVEHGGSGGRVAGPVANQLIHALQDEHYLPGGTP